LCIRYIPPSRHQWPPEASDWSVTRKTKNADSKQGVENASAGDIRCYSSQNAPNIATVPAGAKVSYISSQQVNHPGPTQYWIAKVLEWLHGQGMARPAAGRGEGRYVLNERFRIHVRELAAHAAYTYLTEHVDHIQTSPDGNIEEGER
jgi:hypothetical protein